MLCLRELGSFFCISDFCPSWAWVWATGNLQWSNACCFPKCRSSQNLGCSTILYPRVTISMYVFLQIMWSNALFLMYGFSIPFYIKQTCRSIKWIQCQALNLVNFRPKQEVILKSSPITSLIECRSLSMTGAIREERLPHARQWGSIWSQPLVYLVGLLLLS